MSYFAKIENGIVTNVILAKGETFAGHVKCNKGVGKGWTYNGSTFSEPTPVAETVVVTSDDINEERTRRIVEGTSVTVTGGSTIPLTGRVEDQINLQALFSIAQSRIASGDTTTTTPFRDRDNVTHNLTSTQIVELWQGGFTFMSSNYQSSWALKAMDPIPTNYKDDQYWP